MKENKQIMKKKIDILIKGNLICNKASRSNLGGGSSLICGVSNKKLEEYNLDNATIINGDLKVKELLYNCCVVITGDVCITPLDLSYVE